MSVLAADRIGLTLGGNRVLDDVSFAFRRGRVTALLGPNGAGKSTLLACLAALRVPDSGAAMLDGVDVQAIDRGDMVVQAALGEAGGADRDNGEPSPAVPRKALDHAAQQYRYRHQHGEQCDPCPPLAQRTAPVPPPFHACNQGARRHHGMRPAVGIAEGRLADQHGQQERCTVHRAIGRTKRCPAGVTPISTSTP